MAGARRGSALAKATFRNDAKARIVRLDSGPDADAEASGAQGRPVPPRSFAQRTAAEVRRHWWARARMV